MYLITFNCHKLSGPAKTNFHLLDGAGLGNANGISGFNTALLLIHNAICAFRRTDSPPLSPPFQTPITNHHLHIHVHRPQLYSRPHHRCIDPLFHQHPHFQAHWHLLLRHHPHLRVHRPPIIQDPVLLNLKSFGYLYELCQVQHQIIPGAEAPVLSGNP